jgi:hypothetical protein
MNPTQRSTAKKLTRSRDECRKWPIRALCKKPVTSNRRFASSAELANHIVEGIWTTDVHSLPTTNQTSCPRGYQERVDRTISTLPVIAPKVPRVRGDLVDVRLRRIRFALEFQHEYRPIDQEHAVRPSSIERKDVFQNRAEPSSIRVCSDGLIRLCLK